MKAAVYYRNSDVRIEEREKPTIGPDELLVKVKASGICGSDVLEWYRVKKAPIVLGHEIAGDIVEVGAEVTKYKVGDRVFVSHHVPCNTCKYCLDDHHSACHTLHTTNFYPGGFAEYVRIPAINVDRGTFVLPPGMDYDAGAFIEPLACVYRAQRKMNITPAKTVLVLGAGIAGLLHIKLAVALGAGRIFATDIEPFRLEKAREFGAADVFDARENILEKVKAANGGHGADIVIICTGALPAFTQGIEAVEPGGTVLFFACPMPEDRVPLPVNDLWRNEVTLTTSYAGAPEDLEGALSLLANRRVRIDDMISHRLPLEKAQEGFMAVAEAKDSLKVILYPEME